MSELTDSGPAGAMAHALAERAAALQAALIELERYVGRDGWEQPPRLFALVHTDDVIAAEPGLAESAGLRGSVDGAPPDALTAIEQDPFAADADVIDDLAAVEWPETVFGCALALERSFLPTTAEADLPTEPDEAAAYVAAHPDRHDVRVVVGVDRDGNTHGVARLVSQPDELLGAENLVPGLSDVLAHTLA